MMNADLKRKIRKLKQFEAAVRAQNNMGDDISLVWDKFFDLRETGKNTAIYGISKLSTMSKDEYKAVIEEYFARVYYEVYIFSGIIDAPVYDTILLDKLGLPPVADEAVVKKRFRELAKEHHPDKGGDAGKFIELMNVYRELCNSVFIR